MTKNEKQLKLIQLLEQIKNTAKDCPAFDEELANKRYSWKEWEDYEDSWGADSICISWWVDEALEILKGKKNAST